MDAKNISIKDINYEELAKECKTEKELTDLTKQFMKNMIENMLKAKIDEYVEKNKERSKMVTIQANTALLSLEEFKRKTFARKTFFSIKKKY